jgi:hypothetical protein
MPKTISQPWFRPFSQPLNTRMPPSFRLHLEGLRKVVHQAVHDRPDIWYMRDDGSNMDENLLDLTTVVLSAGLDLLDQFHDPLLVLELIETGGLLNPESPRAYELRETIQDYLADSTGTAAN